MKIFIVEDDPVIASAVAEHIASWGCETRIAQNFQNIVQEFVDFDPQLVLLDVGLPFYNGYHWCSEIRRFSSVPIIFIAKPFDLNVLTAKVQAMLRRTYDLGGQARLLQHRDAVLNTDDSTLTYHGERVELTKNEYRILQVLMENKGKTVSRDVLMQRLWESDSFVDENTLSVNVARLRKKLDGAGLENFIATKKGMGYIVE